MSNDHVLTDLPDYLQGRLTEEDRARIGNHLSVCPECRTEANAIAATLDLLKHRKLAAPPAAYWTSLAPRIRERMDTRPRNAVALRVLKASLPVATAVLLIAFLVNFPAGDVERRELSGIIADLPAEEVATLVDEEIISTVLAGTIASRDAQTEADDRTAIAELLDEAMPELMTELADESTILDGLSGTDLDELASLLEQRFKNL